MKNWKELLSFALCIIMIFGVSSVCSAEDSSYLTVWQADPSFLTGKSVGADVTCTSNNNTPSPNVVTKEQDSDGYYYKINHPGANNGYSYFQSGSNESIPGLEWLGNIDVLKAIAPYLYFSYSYRISSSSELAASNVIIYPTDKYRDPSKFNYLGYFSQKGVTNTGWHTVSPAHIPAGSWGSYAWGYGNIGVYSKTGVDAFIDLRDMKLQLKYSDKTMIDNALKNTGYTFFDLVSHFNGDVTPGGETDEPNDIEYDINSDMKINIIDLVRCKKIISGVCAYSEKCDINRDGQINAEDCTILVKVIVNGIDENNILFLPKEITVSIYDNSCSSYSVCWNSVSLSSDAKLEITKADDTGFAKSFFIKPESSYFTSFDYNDSPCPYYIYKAVITGLESDTRYIYRIVDAQNGIVTESASFKTLSDDKDSFSFIQLTDTQVSAGALSKNNKYALGTGIPLKNTIDGINKVIGNYDFVIHTGDVVEYSKYEAYWQSMIETNKSFFGKNIISAISGNHEAIYKCGDSETFKHFSVDTGTQSVSKGYYYYYDYLNTRFIFLNTNELSSTNGLMAVQYSWLVDLLKNNPQKWTVVSMHHPMYSPGYWGSDTSVNNVSLALRNQLAGLFAEYGVDLVLQGHDHVYAQTYPIDKNKKPIIDTETQVKNGVKYLKNPKGTIYSMIGTSGDQTKNLSSVIDTSLFERYSKSNVSSWGEITISDNELVMNTWHYNNGSPEIFNSFGIIK